MGVVLPETVTSRIDAFETYLRVERDRGRLTIARYRKIVDAFFGHLAAEAATTNLLLSELTTQHCVAFLGSPGGTATKEPSASVWNQRRAALLSFFSWLVAKEVIVKNPVLGTERHKVSSKIPAPLSFDEFIALIDAAEASAAEYRARNVAIVLVLFNTALRVRELVSLNVDQIDWSTYDIRDVPTKGKKWLDAPINDMTAESLERLLLERGERVSRADDPLFLSRRGTRMSVRRVEQLVKGLAKMAGIQRDVTPHLLRHSIVTAMSRGGEPLTIPQRLCNHASVRTTERYNHTQPDEVRAAVDRVGATVARRIRERRRARNEAKCA